MDGDVQDAFAGRVFLQGKLPESSKDGARTGTRAGRRAAGPGGGQAQDKEGRRPLRTTAPNLTGTAEAGNLVPSRSSFRLPGCVPAAR